MLQLVLESLYYFYGNIFSETLSRTLGFSGNFKTISQKIIHFLFGKLRKMLRISETFSHFIFYNELFMSQQTSFMTWWTIKLSMLNRQTKYFDQYLYKYRGFKIWNIQDITLKCKEAIFPHFSENMEVSIWTCQSIL